MNLDLLVRASVLTAAMVLISQPAAAQNRAGSVFAQIFNVGGADEITQGQQGISGSIGCGNGPPNDDEFNPDSLFQSDGDIYDFCNNLTVRPEWGDAIAADPNGSVQRMQAGYAPDELFMQTDQASALASIQINNVSQRIAQIRLARRGLEDLGGYALERGKGMGPAVGAANAASARGPYAPESILQAGDFAAALQRGFSSGDGFLGIEGLSVFLNGEYTRLDAANSATEVGSEGNGGGFTLGIDKQLGESAYLGLAFGYSYLATDFNRGFGESELHDLTFSTYGSMFFGEYFYVDGVVSGSILLFDQKRSVPTGLGGVFSDLESKPEGWNVTADVGMGGEFSLKPVDLNPYLRAAVSQTEIGGFEESGSSLALDIDDQNNTSVTLSPGLSISLPVSTSFGVVSPYVRGEYVHEFGDQADDVRGNLRLIPGASFRLTPNKTDEDYGRAGGGVTTTLGHGVSVFADYDVLLGFSNLVVHTATIGGRLQF